MPCFADINVEDLRTVELAMPIFHLNYLRRERPDWLDLNENLGFEGWKGYGPLPPKICKRFPDR